MISSFSQLDLKSPDLYPTRTVGIPELLHSDGGGQTSLIGSSEHRVHVPIRSEEKDADVLLWQSAIDAQYAQHSMERVEWR